MITTAAVVLKAEQPPPAAMVYVTVYVPDALLPRLIVPLFPLRERPLGLAVYVPPEVPVRVTEAVPVVPQYGVPA